MVVFLHLRDDEIVERQAYAVWPNIWGVVKVTPE